MSHTMNKKKLKKMLESAKKGLGIANKLPNDVDRRKHKSRIMRNMNVIRALLSKS